MKPTLTQTQSLQIVTQLLVGNVVQQIHYVLVHEFVEFSAEDLASVGLTSEVLNQLQTILDRLKAMAATVKPNDQLPPS